MKFNLISCPISGIRIEKNLSKYHLSAKMGTFFKFDYTQLSNQKHYHDSYEFVLVLDGKGTFQCLNESRVLSKGDLFVSDPGMHHEIHIQMLDELTLIYFFLHIHERTVCESTNTEERIVTSFLKEHRIFNTNQKHLLAYIDFLQSYSSAGKPSTVFWLTKALENFIFDCVESAAVFVPSQNDQINAYGDVFDSILDYIDQNLDKKITADDIAIKACTSKRNLYHMFQHKLNRTVNDYVNQRKILLAQHYLNMNISISDTSKLVGIESLSYFNKLFRKYKDVSPSEYRKQCMSNGISYGRRLL